MRHTHPHTQRRRTLLRLGTFRPPPGHLYTPPATPGRAPCQPANPREGGGGGHPSGQEPSSPTARGAEHVRPHTHMSQAQDGVGGKTGRAHPPSPGGAQQAHAHPHVPGLRRYGGYSTPYRTEALAQVRAGCRGAPSFSCRSEQFEHESNGYLGTHTHAHVRTHAHTRTHVCIGIYY